jgi:phospholipase C
VLTRRDFLAGAAAVAVAPRAALAPARLPHPSRSGIDHIVVVTMENRSFDHFLGWLPHADGKQAGLTYTDSSGVPHSTYRLAPEFQGCAHPDPGHEVASAQIEWNNGACDGWLRTGRNNDLFPIGYYTRADLRFLGAAAPQWTVCDSYFAPFLGPTFPNRQYLLCARADRIDDSFTKTDLPTIFDRLQAKRVSVKHYSGQFSTGTFSFLFLWNHKYDPIERTHAQFFADCKRGTLPRVSFVDPDLTFTDVGPQSGIWNDDHPHADVRAGEWFLQQVYRAVTTSRLWPRTLLVITYDEWGGFFDHVPPPAAAADLDPSFLQRGFRVPTLLISPYARRAHVDHTVYDHTSILRLIEWRFGLAPLAVRDAHATNLANALDFSRRNLHAPQYRVPKLVAGPPC